MGVERYETKILLFVSWAMEFTWDRESETKILLFVSWAMEFTWDREREFRDLIPTIFSHKKGW
jgi:hypothetical protein